MAEDARPVIPSLQSRWLGRSVFELGARQPTCCGGISSGPIKLGEVTWHALGGRGGRVPFCSLSRQRSTPVYSVENSEDSH
jgi:hypothetical protein